jgi:hypothetical protein
MWSKVFFKKKIKLFFFPNLSPCKIHLQGIFCFSTKKKLNFFLLGQSLRDQKNLPYFLYHKTGGKNNNNNKNPKSSIHWKPFMNDGQFVDEPQMSSTLETNPL